MSNLNVNHQDGRIVQATETPIAVNSGNRVARPVETAKMARGTLGDYSGDLDEARAIGEAGKQVGNMINDSVTRMVNLQIAEEETKRSLYEVEWQNTEKAARQTAREIAEKDGLDTDGEQAVYQMERDKNTGYLKDKYQFVTKVGNDIDQRSQLWTDHADIDYVSSVIEPRRVDAVKGNMIRSMQAWTSSTVDQIAKETDPVKAANLMQETTARIREQISSPQMVAVFGSAATEEMAKKYISEMQLDSIAVLSNNNPEAAVALLRNETGDPETDKLYGMDSTARRQALYQAEKENNARIAEANRQLKEKQEKNEFELSYQIATGQLSGPSVTATIYKAYHAGEIDQSHGERLIAQNEARMERRARQAEAAEARAERKAEKQRAIYQPVNDAIDTGLQLDPKNPTHVKSVDAYASAVIARDPSKATEVLLDITKQTGIAPKSLRSQIYGMINSKDAKQAIQGTQLLTTIAATTPGIVNSLSDETVSKAHQIELGVHPDQAQLNIERVRTLTKEQIADYKKAADGHASKIDSWIAETFGVANDDVKPEVRGHYREILKDQLVLSGGNIEAAKTAANTIMRKSYGVSHVTGKPTLMFNAPEGVNGKTDWMSEQFKSDLASLNLKPEQIQLRANTEGTYDILALNDSGVPTGYLVDPATGKRQVWKPDVELVMKQQRDAQAAATKKRNDDEIAAAEEKRAKFLKKSQDEAEVKEAVSAAWKKTTNNKSEPLAFGRFKNGKQ